MMTAAPAEFADPHPAADNRFGATVTVLTNGNVVITSPLDDAGATNAGAVYVFNGQTGALISTLVGSHQGDKIGDNGVVALSNGNFVIRSTSWDNGSLTDAGAVTFGSGTTGVNGTVSASNSLIGVHSDDKIGETIQALSNGNYVVVSPRWDNGATVDCGAVTLGNGTLGTLGIVSSSNSLVGTQAADKVGDGGITVLTNGNFVVMSGRWDNGSIVDAGAVTFISGTAGLTGAVSDSNSLVGTHADDRIGDPGDLESGVTALSTGNYVVNSPLWDNGGVVDAGAVTFGNGTSGKTGPVSALNSLVGSQDGDKIGGGFFNGSEMLSGGVTALTNGNYIVASPAWKNGTAAGAGAVTFANGAIGLAGPVTSTNSLVGTHALDTVGGAQQTGRTNASAITPLTNGNYVVASPYWHNGDIVDAGAVTFGNGNTGVKGAVTASNSLVGTHEGDSIGGAVILDDLIVAGGITALTNGNYVVASPGWNNGSLQAAGAVTWANGMTGITGPVTTENSLFGTHEVDFVGGIFENTGEYPDPVTALSNGNYVVSSMGWQNGTSRFAGAATFGNGASGITGPVTAANSLVGTSQNDGLLQRIFPLPTGNYVVVNASWSNGSMTSAGAVTRGSGLTGIKGEISSTNSLIGTHTGDHLGEGGITALTNGHYVINSPAWNSNAGALTYGNGNVGVNAASVNSNNSLTDITLNEFGIGVVPLNNGNFVVNSLNYAGEDANSGVVLFEDGTTTLHDSIISSHTVFGATTGAGFQAFVVPDSAHSAFFVSFPTDGSGHVYRGSATSGFNLPPTNITLSANTVSEQQPIGRTVGVLSANDPNAGSSLTYSLVSGSGSTDNASFTIVNGVTRTLKTAAIFDYNTKHVYSIRVRATDSDGLYTEQVFTINVTGVNQAPTNILLSNNSVDEHQPLTTIGQLTTIDPDSGNTFTYLLNNDYGNPDNSHFFVQEDGTLQGFGFDYKTQSSYTISVYSFDQDGLFISKDITIYVNDLAIPPTDIELSAITVAEKKIAGTIVGKLTTTDADSYNNFTYTLGTGGDNAAFTIDAQGFLRTTAPLYVAVKNSYTISITSKDESNLAITESFTITVTPVAAGGATELPDPNAFEGNQFGASVTALPNGNVVVTSPYDDLGGTDAGAVYLYDGQTGALISSLRGSHVNDRVGLDGITALTNGNFLVRSAFWNTVGAVTFVNGATGLNGTVSSANSLVGSTGGDQLGSGGIVALPNGNYVISSPEWNNGALNNAGGVTFGNGTTGVSGIISSSNSLVGMKANDFVGGGGITVLTNGNYVINSRSWDNGAVVDVGAVTFANGMTGITGTISATNSLVGSQANDTVGARGNLSGVTALKNGNYVVVSQRWDNGPSANAGAVTFGSGVTGVTGAVSSANSLVGTTANDGVGSEGVTALDNGNYVVRSGGWDNVSAVDAGAVTFASGTSGIKGAVTSGNSLVGSHANDRVGGSGITLLSNGNYVVLSFVWDNGTTVDAGAVTFGSRTNGVSGTVSAINSLVGTQTTDQVGSGGVTALTNGNYVIASPFWNNGAAADAGAVTWGSGTTGVSGTVSPTNSLVGSQAADMVSNGGVRALTNGNYVVSSYLWDFGAIADAGAATFVNGATGRVGPVSSANSLVGSHDGDNVGRLGSTALTNGNYVVGSLYWDNGTTVNAGAATFGNGITGISGEITAANSLVGTHAEDQTSWYGITALSNGNYVVASPAWDFESIIDAGAVTFGNGTTGITGAVSQTNGFVGGTAGDSVGATAVIALANGNYVISSNYWDNGSILDAGAVTFGNGASGSTGIVSATNSLVGDLENGYAGGGGITPLSNGSYLVLSYHFDDVSAPNPQSALAVSYGNSTIGVSGTLNFQTNGLPISTDVFSPLPFLVTDNAHSAIYVSTYSEGSGHVYIGSTTSGLFKSPPTSIALSETTMTELPAIGTSVGNFSTIDPDSGDTFTYSLVSGDGSDDNARFSITANGGLLTAASFDYETKPFASIRVRSTDQSGLFTEEVFTISLIDQNEAPTALSLINSIIAENLAGQTIVGSFNTVDPDSGNTFSYLLVVGSGSADNGSFTIDANGQLRTAASFDFEDKASYSIRVRATDQGNLSFEAPLTITVSNANEAPAALSLSALSIAENNPAGATIGNLTAIDPDSGNTFTYSLAAGTGDADNASFDITDNELTINAPADLETQSAYSIRIRVTDQGGLTFEKPFTITISDVNEAPTDVTLSASSIAENNAPNATIGTLSGLDPDSGSILTFGLIAGAGSTDNSSFSVTGNTLTIIPSTDFETKNSYSIRVAATDQGGLTFEKIFTISVTRVNEAPTSLVLSTTSIPENHAANATIGTLSAGDPNTGDTFAYSLVTGPGSDDNTSFSISGNALTINSVANYEVRNSYSIRIRVTDQGGLTFEKPFTITISDVNEAPTDVTLSASSIAENNTPNATIGTLSGLDPDSGSVLTYGLIAGAGSTDNSSFSVTGNTLSIIPSTDFETKNSYSIRVAATDQGGLTFEKIFTISVTRVNEAPTSLVLSTTSIPENHAANATIGTLSASDPNTGDTFAYSLVTGPGSDDNTSFSISGNALTINSVTNYEARNAYSIRIRVTDQGGLTFEKPFTITISDVNEAPTDVTLSTSSIAENNAPNATIGTLSGLDPDSASVLTYGLIAGAGSTDNSSFSITGNTLTIIPSTDFETKNSYSIRVAATDQGGLTFEKIFTISVTRVNEAPTSLVLSTASIPENHAANATIGTLSATDPNTGDTFAYSLVTGPGSDDNTSFSISGNALTINSVTNYEARNAYSIRIRVTDQGGLTFEKPFTITISDVNEAPTDVTLSTSSIAENNTPNATIGTLSGLDPDSASVLTYGLIAGAGSTDNSSFSVTGNTLSIIPSTDFETKNSYSIRVAATDQGGLTFEKIFTISVTRVNEAPTSLVLSTTSIPENHAANATIGTLSAGDPNTGDTFAYSLVTGPGSDDNTSFSISGNALTINSVTNYEARNAYSIRIRVTDQGGLTFEKPFTITISDVNEAPTDVTLSASSIAENNAPNATIGTLSGLDPDSGSVLAYGLIAGAGSTDNSSFSVTGNTLSIIPSTDFETKNSYSIRVAATDQGGLTFEKIFTISVTRVNEAPTSLVLSTTSIPENHAANATIGTLSASDPNTGDTFAYSLVTGPGSDDNTSFSISGNALTINSVTNYEARNAYSIRICVTDQGGLTFEKPFTITVSDVNEAPTDVTLSTSSIAENNTPNATIGTLSGLDPDSGSVLTYGLIAGAGSTDNSSFSVTGNTLSIIPSTDFETKNSYSIRVAATDQGGLTFEKIFTISVTRVNEAPTSLVLSTTSIPENHAANATIGTLSATDPNTGDTFAYSLVTGPGSDDSTSFSISGNALTINSVTNYEARNAYSIRIRVTDQGGLTFEKPFTITISDVNEAPTDVTLSTSSIAENNAPNAIIGTLSGLDPDSGSVLTYGLIAGAGSTDNGSFSITGNTLTIIPSTDFETKNSYSIRVRVTDQDGLTFEKPLTITVTDSAETVAPTLNSVAVTVVSNKAMRVVNVLPQIVVGGTNLGGGTLIISLNSPGRKKPKDTLQFPSGLGTIPAPTKTGSQFVWEFHLSSNVTSVTIESFLRNLKFSTKGSGLGIPTRSLQIKLTTAGSQPATFNQSITVIKK